MLRILVFAAALFAVSCESPKVHPAGRAVRKHAWTNVGAYGVGVAVLCNGDTVAYTGHGICLVGKYRGDQGPLQCP